MRQTMSFEYKVNGCGCTYQLGLLLKSFVKTSHISAELATRVIFGGSYYISPLLSI
jgi:hypothetical protein